MPVRTTSRRRPKRTRLATAIYSDRYGVGIVVRGKEHRYPRGTPLDELRRARRELLEEAGPVHRRGTLDADVATYLAALPEGTRRAGAKAWLRHWQDAEGILDGRPVRFGDVSRHALTSVMLAQQLAAWADTFTPSSRKHLRRELGSLYKTLNGRAGANPVADVPPVHVRYEEPRALPYEAIRLILDALPDRGLAEKGGKRPKVSLTKLRLTITAYSGIPPAVLMRVRERDLDLEAGTVYCRPRRKGKGTRGYTQPLTPQAREAFRQLVAAGGLGPYSTHSQGKAWHRAVKLARAAWQKAHPGTPWPAPENVRAYDLRHAFASKVMATTGNLHAVASLLMHSSLSTTRRYVQGVVHDEARAAVEAVAASMPLPRPPVKLAENGRQRQSVATRRRKAS